MPRAKIMAAYEVTCRCSRANESRRIAREITTKRWRVHCLYGFILLQYRTIIIGLYIALARHVLQCCNAWDAYAHTHTHEHVRTHILKFRTLCPMPEWAVETLAFRAIAPPDPISMSHRLLTHNTTSSGGTPPGKPAGRHSAHFPEPFAAPSKLMTSLAGSSMNVHHTTRMPPLLDSRRPRTSARSDPTIFASLPLNPCAEQVCSAPNVVGVSRLFGPSACCPCPCRHTIR